MRISDWSSDGCSSDLRLHHHLAHRRGLDALQGIVEILARHAELVEHLGRDRSFLEIELGHDPPHLLDRRLAGQRRHVGADEAEGRARQFRSEEHTSELQSLMTTSYAVFCLKKKTIRIINSIIIYVIIISAKILMMETSINH